MIDKEFERQNEYGSAWILYIQLNRWLQLRLDALTSLFFIVLGYNLVMKNAKRL